MLLQQSFAGLLRTKLSDFEILEKLSQLSHELFPEADADEVLLQLYGVFCNGEIEQLKELFFQAFRAEQRHFDHQVAIVDHLWVVPIDRSIRLSWLIELLHESRPVQILWLLRQAVPTEAESLANEIIMAIHQPKIP